MKLLLPVTYPPITSFPYIANQMSFLWTHKDQVLPWYSDRYIQLMIRPHHPLTRADFYEEADMDNFLVPSNLCPFYGFLRNNQTTAHFEKFTDYIEYNIQKEYYIEPCLDNYYLSCSPDYYHTEHNIHTAFIYGFDNVKKEVYLSDFFEHGRYVNATVPYEEMNQSIEGIDYFIGLYKYQDANYTFNLKLLQTFIEDYLNCRDSFKKFEFSSPFYNRDILYGLDYYDYIKNVICEEENIDIRPFHTLYDHKIIMSIRLEYLYSHHYINDLDFPSLLNMSASLMKRTFDLRKLVLDYYIFHNESLRPKIKQQCDTVKTADYNFFSKLLKALV